MAGAEGQAATVRVLAADDLSVNRALLAIALSALGADLTVARDGAEAVDLFERQAFDAVLMDVRMPVMDGLAAVRAIRAIERRRRGGARAAIAMLTSEPAERFGQAAMAAGADAYLAKPFEIARLAAFIAAARASIDAVAPASRDDPGGPAFGVAI
jgi:CheY-like chemotaxis protein